MAEAFITKPSADWTADDDRFSEVLHSDPDRALATIFGMMQLSDDPKVHGTIAAGPLEDFLGAHGESYLDVFHLLAIKQARLRDVLDGVWQGAMPKRVWHRIEVLQKRAFS